MAKEKKSILDIYPPHFFRVAKIWFVRDLHWIYLFSLMGHKGKQASVASTQAWEALLCV